MLHHQKQIKKSHSLGRLRPSTKTEFILLQLAYLKFFSVCSVLAVAWLSCCFVSHVGAQKWRPALLCSSLVALSCGISLSQPVIVLSCLYMCVFLRVYCNAKSWMWNQALPPSALGSQDWCVWLWVFSLCATMWKLCVCIQGWGEGGCWQTHGCTLPLYGLRAIQWQSYVICGMSQLKEAHSMRSFAI